MELTVTEVFRKNQRSSKRIKVNRGSIRSSKTFSLVQLAVIWLSQASGGAIEVWTIARKTLPALKGTAYRDFQEIVSTLELWPFIKSNLSELQFTFNNRTIEFLALDEPTKLKSRKRNHLHIVEVSEISYRMWIDLIARTSGDIYVDFNPDDPYSWVREQVEEKRAEEIGDVELIVSTYKDNPFLEPSIVREIEMLEHSNPSLWQVYGLGNYGSIDNLIYPHYELGEYTGDYDNQYVGIDFGFSSSPAAVVLVGCDGHSLYLKEIIYETGLLNDALAEKIIAAGIGHFPMVADAAEPKSIAALNASGLSVARSVKGADSVRSGIAAVKEYGLIVDPSSINLIKELRSYKWMEGKHGVPIKMSDHLCDGIRMTIQKFMRRSGGFTLGGAVSNTTPFHA